MYYAHIYSDDLSLGGKHPLFCSHLEFWPGFNSSFPWQGPKLWEMITDRNYR